MEMLSEYIHIISLQIQIGFYMDLCTYSSQT